MVGILLEFKVYSLIKAYWSLIVVMDLVMEAFLTVSGCLHSQAIEGGILDEVL